MHTCTQRVLADHTVAVDKTLSGNQMSSQLHGHPLKEGLSWWDKYCGSAKLLLTHYTTLPCPYKGQPTWPLLCDYVTRVQIIMQALPYTHALSKPLMDI